MKFLVISFLLFAIDISLECCKANIILKLAGDNQFTMDVLSLPMVFLLSRSRAEVGF